MAIPHIKQDKYYAYLPGFDEDYHDAALIFLRKMLIPLKSIIFPAEHENQNQQAFADKLKKYLELKAFILRDENISFKAFLDKYHEFCEFMIETSSMPEQQKQLNFVENIQAALKKALLTSELDNVTLSTIVQYKFSRWFDEGGNVIRKNISQTEATNGFLEVNNILSQLMLNWDEFYQCCTENSFFNKYYPIIDDSALKQYILEGDRFIVESLTLQLERFKKTLSGQSLERIESINKLLGKLNSFLSNHRFKSSFAQAVYNSNPINWSTIGIYETNQKQLWLGHKYRYFTSINVPVLDKFEHYCNDRLVGCLLDKPKPSQNSLTKDFDKYQKIKADIAQVRLFFKKNVNLHNLLNESDSEAFRKELLIINDPLVQNAVQSLLDHIPQLDNISNLTYAEKVKNHFEIINPTKQDGFF